MNSNYTPAPPSANDRPREKAGRSGIESLNDTELLALLIGSGNRSASVYQLAESARLILEDHVSSPDEARKPLENLRGMGGAKSLMLSAAMELGRRHYTVRGARKISGPEDAYEVLKHYGDRSQEHFFVLCLNGAHQLTRSELVTMGLLNRSMVHPREVFAPAIEARSASIIIAHNHPSGNLEPSDEDRAVTRRIAEAGELLGIGLLDHIVFGADGWVSMRELGQL